MTAVATKIEHCGKNASNRQNSFILRLKWLKLKLWAHDENIYNIFCEICNFSGLFKAYFNKNHLKLVFPKTSNCDIVVRISFYGSLLVWSKSKDDRQHRTLV
jgi:hypothetical protein